MVPCGKMPTRSASFVFPAKYIHWFFFDCWQVYHMAQKKATRSAAAGLVNAKTLLRWTDNQLYSWVRRSSSLDMATSTSLSITLKTTALPPGHQSFPIDS